MFISCVKSQIEIFRDKELIFIDKFYLSQSSKCKLLVYKYSLNKNKDKNMSTNDIERHLDKTMFLFQIKFFHDKQVKVHIPSK